MIIRDVMTEDVISVLPEEKIGRVAALLTEKRIHGVPVVKDGILVGIITETDFFTKDSFNLHLPSYIDFIEKTKFSGKIGGSEREKMKELISATAKDIMSVNCITVSPNDSIEMLLAIIKEKNIHTVPVVDSSGRINGIVTRSDLIRLVEV